MGEGAVIAGVSPLGVFGKTLRCTVLRFLNTLARLLSPQYLVSLTLNDVTLTILVTFIGLICRSLGFMRSEVELLLTIPLNDFLDVVTPL
jgi:hypothetical protein